MAGVWRFSGSFCRGFASGFRYFPGLAVCEVPFKTNFTCPKTTSLEKIAKPPQNECFFQRQKRSHKKSVFSKMPSEKADRIVWIDLEMTGLDVQKDKIIEIACIITDSQLKIVVEGPNLIINCADKILDSMDDWCKSHHGDSGLTKSVKESKITLEDAEKQIAEFIKSHTPPKVCPLAGNSVHVDKKFLEMYMPSLIDHLHYRIVDVSTVKEVCRRWFPKIYENAPPKLGAHRALDDIKESIKEMQFYKDNVFIQT